MRVVLQEPPNGGFCVVSDYIARAVGTGIADGTGIEGRVELCTNDRHGLRATPHFSVRRIPFDLMITIPPPLRRGVDYGFLPGTNVSQSAAESALAA